MTRNSAGVGVSSGISRTRKYHCKASAARSEGFRFSFLAARFTRRTTAAGSFIEVSCLAIIHSAYHRASGCQGAAQRKGVEVAQPLLAVCRVGSSTKDCTGKSACATKGTIHDRARLLQVVPKNHATLHHELDSFHLRDVREWIARDGDDIGESPFLHIANLVSQIVVQGLSGNARGRLQRL